MEDEQNNSNVIHWLSTWY